MRAHSEWTSRASDRSVRSSSGQPSRTVGSARTLSRAAFRRRGARDGPRRAGREIVSRTRGISGVREIGRQTGGDDARHGGGDGARASAPGASQRTRGGGRRTSSGCRGGDGKRRLGVARARFVVVVSGAHGVAASGASVAFEGSRARASGAAPRDATAVRRVVIVELHARAGRLALYITRAVVVVGGDGGDGCGDGSGARAKMRCCVASRAAAATTESVW